MRPMPSRDQSCGCNRGPNVERGKWYGVRSYLHLFYEDCTGAGLADDVTEAPVSRAHGGWPSLVWKVRTTSGSPSCGMDSGVKVGFSPWGWGCSFVLGAARDSPCPEEQTV
uniref:NRSN2 n=1 Tax=Chelydra serpentina TaxID=8475 RepID=A0A8C3RKH5_CHESE